MCNGWVRAHPKQLSHVWVVLMISTTLLTACAEAEVPANASSSPFRDSAIRDVGFENIPVGLDHVTRDDEGSYFCVLRRPDDLAVLRSQFSG